MARQKQVDDFRFEGFTTPNTTPVPDVVFDKLLARLGEAELKALLYIIRRTFGFKRDRDPISFNQFLRGITTRDGRVLDEGCGISSRTTLSTALRSLEAKGIVLSEKGMDERGENETTIYRLRFRAGDPAAADDHHLTQAGVVRNSYHPGTEFALPVVRNSYPQETVLQETDIDHSNIRKSTRSNDDFVDNSLSHPISTTPSVPIVHHGMEPMATILERRSGQSQGTSAAAASSESTDPPRRQRGRPRKYSDEVSQTILSYVTDFSREFADQATVNQSAARFINDFHKWERGDINAFIGVLYQARAITKAQSKVRNRFAYFAEVVEDLLRLREDAAASPQTSYTQGQT